MTEWVFISGRYRDPDPEVVKGHIIHADKVARMYQRKYHVFTPHKNWSGMEGEVSHYDILLACLDFIMRCPNLKAIVMLDNWRESEYAQWELAVARARGIEVWYENESTRD